jgi:hypothetical protein
LNSKSSSRPIQISESDIEISPLKVSDNDNIKTVRTEVESKSLLRKNKTPFIKQKYLNKNLTGLKSKTTVHPSFNQILSHNVSPAEYLEQLSLKRSKKQSISLSTINSLSCCHNYSKICCNQSQCILQDRYISKNNCITNSAIFETKHPKYDSMNMLDFVDNTKIRINSDIEQVSNNSLQKSNLTFLSSRLKEHYIEDIFKSDNNFFNEMNNYPTILDCLKKDKMHPLLQIEERKVSKKIKRKEAEFYKIMKIKNEMYKRKYHSILKFKDVYNSESLSIDDRGDLRMELSRRRAERLNKLLPMQSTRLLQSAFQEVVNEYVN